MKNTMNSRNIAKMNKLLEQDVSIKKIGTYLGIDEATLKKFAPKAAKKASKKEAEATEE